MRQKRRSVQGQSLLQEGAQRPVSKGDKSTYTEKQRRQAEHIEQGYEQRGAQDDEAERRAWATVNKESGGGKKSGSGRGHPEDRTSAHRGGARSSEASAGTPTQGTLRLGEESGRNAKASRDRATRLGASKRPSPGQLMSNS